MSIMIDENTVAIWHFDVLGGNFLGGLQRKPDGTFVFTYRLRWYQDDKIDDSADVRRWYCMKISCQSEVTVLARIRKVTDAVASVVGSRVDEIRMVNQDLDAFMQVLGKMTWAHARVDGVEGKKPN